MNKKTKQILAIIAVIAIVALYVVAAVYAFVGGKNSTPVVMGCIVLAMAIAVYCYIGKVLAGIMKRHGKDKEEASGGENDGK